MQKTHDSINRLCALGVFLFVGIVYFFVAAPSLSFWDCGEYVASAVSLGIPHPPGNPFFMLLGRAATVLLPFIQDVSRRIIMIEILCAAFTAMLVYLSIVRIFISVIGTPDTISKRISVYTGGIVGALFAIFATTALFSFVETEVNGPLLLPIIICSWLALVWQQSKDPRRDKYLLLISYIAFLGIGIHMYSMLCLPPIFLFVVLNDREKLYDARLWITVLISSLVMYNISWFIVLGSLLTVFNLAFSFIKSRNQAKWAFCFWIVCFALLGFSTHIFIPIRAALNPIIDENHPVITMDNKGINFEAFQGYLERKQYGSESMISRMFWRRGSWGHQFGIEGHMGFGGFMLTQFFRFSPMDTQQSLFTPDAGMGFLKLMIYLIPIGLMIFAWNYLGRRNWRTAVLFISLEVVTTVCMVLYMNFADGEHSERGDYEAWMRAGRQGAAPLVQREVRVRDYFYIVGFMYYAMWVGVAAGAILLLLFASKRRFLRTTLAPICAVLWLVSPALPMSQNLGLHNRRFDFLPWDYAYNLLMSCARNGILFTNGDNDTFPLWALQEGYGVRKDVRLVNLSLANTDWYIKQLRDLEPKAPVTFSDKQIAALQPEYNPFPEDLPFKMDKAGISVIIPGRQKKHAMLVQDKLVLNIVNANNWNKPIYFSTTVSSEHFMGLDPYLQMQGLVYRVMKYEVPAEERFDLDRTLFMMSKVYRFRALGQKSATIEENAQALVSNYAACFMQTAFTLQRSLGELAASIAVLKSQTGTSADQMLIDSLTQKETEYKAQLATATTVLDQCISLMPWDWRPRRLLQDLLVTHNQLDAAEIRFKEALRIEPSNPNYLRMDSQLEDLKARKAKGDTTPLPESMFN
jgi:hypothetical protein